MEIIYIQEVKAVILLPPSLAHPALGRERTDSPPPPQHTHLPSLSFFMSLRNAPLDPLMTTGTTVPSIDLRWKCIVNWHKRTIRLFKDCTGLSTYQLLWISFLKGLLMGMVMGSW